ncbi:MAG: MBL fold metallo-hydrolase [Chloroflexota bacterium]|nr:MBL fold metallo-hydrolase [Chloroflexota bacterium]
MVKQIIQGVYEISTRFGAANAFLIDERDMTLIDTGPKGSSSKLEKLIRELGRSSGELGKIIITHCHFDHTGDVASLVEKTGASVAIHEADADYISKVDPYPAPKLGPLSWIWSRTLLPILGSPPVDPDIQLMHNYELDILGGLRVIHTPGHTPGSICLYSQENRILFAGDVLRNSRSNILLPYRLFTSDWAQAQRSLAEIAKLEIDTICFGHGETITHNASDKLQELIMRYSV